MGLLRQQRQLGNQIHRQIKREFDLHQFVAALLDQRYVTHRPFHCSLSPQQAQLSSFAPSLPAQNNALPTEQTEQTTPP